MTTKAIKKNIFESIKRINDVQYLKALQDLVVNKAQSESFVLSRNEIALLEKRSVNAKKNLNKLKTWDEVKKILLSGK